MLWIAVAIVAAVGLYYILQGFLALGTDIDITGMEGYEELFEDLIDAILIIVAGLFIFLGIFSLILAFLLYSGSNGGRTVLIIVLAIAIFFSVFDVVSGGYLSLIELILAIAVLVILYQPQMIAYFKPERTY